MIKPTFLLLLAETCLLSLVQAAPLAIDLTADTPPPAAAPYGPGATKNPQGREITADSRSFFLDGKPWIPVVGEFHFARYPREEWRDELLKMKAGGIDTVSTYVFWIHHEEEQGKWDWSGRRSLHDFIRMAQEAGLKVIVRMGPWCHGEARNGGFPDWVQNSGTHLREKDPAFLKLVARFFARTDVFALGVCNGCQMLAALAPMIPGADAWPSFTRNRSEQFEARLGMVEVLPSPSIFFRGMAGSRLPIAVAHGEGFANFAQRGDAAKVHAALRFVDHTGAATEAYPANPNGSAGGLTGVTTADGRYTALMPHPERVFRNVQMSWTSGDRSARSPWMRIFENARRALG